MKKIVSLTAALVSVLSINVVFADSAKLVNPANNHSYKRFDAAKTWAQAKNSCASLGAHLATISDQAENDFIFNKIFSGFVDGAWIGGSDAQTEGTWKWITGEQWSYTNWNPPVEPNNGDGGDPQNSLAIVGSWGGTWDDGWGNSPGSAYICEWEQPDNIYSQVVSLADVNHNGTADYALLGEKGTNYTLFVYDGSSHTLINQATVKPKLGYAVKSFTVTNDANGDGVAEIAVLVVKTGNVATLQLHDPVTGAIVSTLSLPKN